MKILYLITSLNMGGSEKFLCELAEEFRKNNDIRVGYFKDCGFFGDKLKEVGIPVVKFTFFSLIAYLKREKIDIVHSFLYRANIYARICGKLAGRVKIICTQQAIDKWKPMPLLMLDILTNRLPDIVITNSNAARASMLKREGFKENKVRLVYNGIDTSVYKPSKTREEVRVSLNIPAPARIAVFLGRLHREKGADILPDIAKRLHGTIFLIIGDGEEKQAILDKVAGYGLEKRFRLMGWRTDTADLLNASDIFVMPSREESFPQAILEAMTQKLPVVARDIGGVGELVENRVNGVLIKDLSPEEFAVSINIVLHSRELTSAFASNSYKKSLEFTKSRMLAGIAGIYSDVMA